jgi:transcriptional regulator of acetoin/glycerol metabolism
MQHDLVERRQRLERERARFDQDPSSSRVSPALLASWVRCGGTVDTAWSAAPGEDSDDAVERWSASPIRRAMPELSDQLLAVAEDGDFLAGITDAEGRVLWSAGGRVMRARGERINFMPGGFWDEPSSGTNAVAMSLITGEPTTMFSFEHWCPAFSDVVCYSAPVRDPVGHVLGVLDLTTSWDRTNPLGLPTVSSMARAIESELARNPTLLSIGVGLNLEVLGRHAASIDGVAWSVTLRQLEILVTLASVGEAGLDEMHALIYGDRMVSP